MFTPDQEAALVRMLEERDNKVFASLTKKLDEVLDLKQHETAKQSKQSFTQLEQQIAGLLEKVDSLQTNVPQTVQASLNAMLDELAKEEIEAQKAAGNDASNSSANAASAGELTEARIAEILAQHESKTAEERKKLENRVRAAEEAQATAEAERQRIAEEQRVARMQEEVIGALSGKVTPNKERRAFKAMLDEGVLVEDKEAGAYRVKSKDKYGEEVLVPVDKVLPTLLQENYSEYLPPRSGTGTGAIANSGVNVSHSAPIYINPDAGLPKNEDMLELAGDDAKFKEVLQELEMAIKA